MMYFEIHNKVMDRKKHEIQRKKTHLQSAGVPVKSEIPNML